MKEGSIKLERGSVEVGDLGSTGSGGWELIRMPGDEKGKYDWRNLGGRD